MKRPAPQPRQIALFETPKPHGFTEHGTPIYMGTTREVEASPRNVTATGALNAPPASLPALPYAGEVPHVDRSTSIAAAAAMEKKVGPLQAKVLLCIYQHGPLSDETLDRLCHVTKPLRPRRREMELAGFVAEDILVKGSSDLWVMTWQLTPKGERKAKELEGGEALLPPPS